MNTRNLKNCTINRDYILDIPQYYTPSRLSESLRSVTNPVKMSYNAQSREKELNYYLQNKCCKDYDTACTSKSWKQL